jgi:hypothetical protein
VPWLPGSQARLPVDVLALGTPFNEHSEYHCNDSEEVVTFVE